MTTEPRRSPFGRARRVLLVLAVLLVAGIEWWLVRDRDDGDALRLYGNVDIREVELAFRQPGRISSMHFDEGDAVAAGDVMATIDAGPYEHSLAAVQAELDASQAELAKLRSGSRPQEVAQAKQAVTQAQSGFDEAQLNFRRQERLLPSGASSQRTVDAARNAREQAAAALASAKSALSLTSEGFRSEDVTAGQARVAAAEAALAQALTALDDTQLVAPSDATVLSRVREPGSMVASTSTVYSLSLRDPVYVRAYVSEPQLGLVAPGTQVRVHTDSSEKAYRGQIGFISPRAEFTPKSVETADLRTDLVYRLRVVVADADEGLRQGMPVTVVVGNDPAGTQESPEP